MARPLLDIPPELIVRIASYLTTPELGPLRASCKQIEKYLFNSFTKEFFTKRQFMLEHESLEALVGIANHPGLAPSLQEVILGTQMFNIEGSSAQAVEALLQNRFRRGYLARNVLIATGQAKAMLVEAFSKLPNLCGVGIRDFDGVGRRRDGEQARWRSWGQSQLESRYLAPPQEYLPLMISALSSANARPAKIEVFLRRSEQFSANSFTLLEGPDTQAVLDNLRTVMLSISMSSSEEFDMMSAHGEIYQAPIKKFLSRIATVEHLRLNFLVSQSLAQPLLDWLSGHVNPAAAISLQGFAVQVPSFSTLSVLDIGMARVKSTTLVKILTRFDLQEFSLWKMYVLPDATNSTEDLWPSFLLDLSRKLPSNTRIQKMMIGFAQQDVVLPSGQMVSYRPVTWAQKGTKPEKKSKSITDAIVKYDGQYTNETATEWIVALSDLAYIHMNPFEQYDSDDTSFGGSDAGLDDDDDDDNDDMEIDDDDEGDTDDS